MLGTFQLVSHRPTNDIHRRTGVQLGALQDENAAFGSVIARCGRGCCEGTA